MQPFESVSKPNHWLSAATIDKSSDVSPFDIMDKLEKHNIETRPIWKPMHMQPYYKDCDYFSHNDYNESICEDIFKRGICLPSDFYPNMTPDEQEEIIEIIKGVF